MNEDLVAVGRYLHSVDGYHVLRGDAKHVPRIGVAVYVKGGKKAGIVADVFGPVSSPYILVRGGKFKEYYAQRRRLWA